VSEHFNPVSDKEVRYSFTLLRDAFAAEFPRSYNRGLSTQAFNKKLRSIRLTEFKHVDTARTKETRGYTGLVLKKGHNFSVFDASPIEVSKQF